MPGFWREPWGSRRAAITKARRETGTTRRIARSEAAWAISILAVSGTLFALTGRASMWDLLAGYVTVHSPILIRRGHPES